MRRPVPRFPRGPRRKRPAGDRELLLACPRVAPDWELAALRALMKPQTKDAIRRRPAGQPWPADALDRIEAARRLVAERLGYEPQVELPNAGDFHLVGTVQTSDLPLALAFATVLSKALPDLWFTLGRLFIRDGRFFRRERGFKLKLVPATNVHLSRETRRALRGAV